MEKIAGAKITALIKKYQFIVATSKTAQTKANFRSFINDLRNIKNDGLDVLAYDIESCLRRFEVVIVRSKTKQTKADLKRATNDLNDILKGRR